MTLPRLPRAVRWTLLSFVLFSPVFAAEAKRRFNLAAGDAAETLPRFAEQADREIVFSPAAVRGVTTNAVIGEYASREALDLLVARTNLVATLDAASGAFAIRVEVPAPNGPRAAQIPASAPAAAQKETGDRVVELSPFVVTAEEDNGYQATSTLSGTRMRTALRDLAPSISVVTKQFMDDLGLDNFDQAAVYTMSTEVPGLAGNFSSAAMEQNLTNFYDPMRANVPTVRIRGLARASRTRDYFLTDIPTDDYNTERTEIQRGPNGMLFGLGSPGGVVNAGLNKANVQKNKGGVVNRIDEHGTRRVSFDLNRVLVPDKLAARIDTLYSDQRNQIEDSFSLSRRAYGSLTYKPFASTTLRVSGEQALRRENPPQARPPNDQFSYWWDIGKPVWNGYTGVGIYLGTPSTNPKLAGSVTTFLDRFASRASGATIVVEEPSTGAYGLSVAGRPQVVELNQIRTSRNAANTAWLNNDHYGLAVATNYVRALYGTPLDTAFWRLPMMTDPTVFDFFHKQLDGAARSRDSRWKNFSLTVDQRLGRSAGIELSFDREGVDYRSEDFLYGGRYTLKLDVTTTLIDGQPNPNFGRAFSSNSNQLNTDLSKHEAFRATAYYDLELQKRLRPGSWIGKILGRHTLTANYSDQSAQTTFFSGFDALDMSWYPQAQVRNTGTTTVANANNGGVRAINYMVYYGPGLGATTSPQNVRMGTVKAPIFVGDTGAKSLSAYYYTEPPDSATVVPAWQTGSFGVVQTDEWNVWSISNTANIRRSEFQNVALVAHSHWFDNTLVSTVGWRRDWARNLGTPGVQFTNAGTINLDPSVFYLIENLNQRKDAFNYGLVLHTPQFIQRHLPRGVDFGLTYNRSDNFSPGTYNVSVNGNVIDPEKGETKEYGLMLSLFDRKVDVRVSHYRTAAALSRNGTLQGGPLLNIGTVNLRAINYIADGQLDFFADNVTPTTAAKAAYLAFLKAPEASPLFHGYDFVMDATGHVTQSAQEYKMSATSDLAAQGWEGEVVLNPTRNWRLALNAARQQTIRTNTGSDVVAMLAAWKPFLFDGPAGNLPQAPGSTATIREAYQRWLADTNRVVSQDGAISPEQRKWRFNVINNYSINEGRLKGWNVGAAVRWQDKVAIGYPITLVEGTSQYDVKHPFFGPTETNVDGWIGYRRRILNDRIGWKVQVNVRNLGVGDKLIPVSSQPNGMIDSYRIAESMSWTLTNSFDF